MSDIYYFQIAHFAGLSYQLADANFGGVKVTNSVTNNGGKNIASPENVLFFSVAMVGNSYVIVQH